MSSSRDDMKTCHPRTRRRRHVILEVEEMTSSHKEMKACDLRHEDTVIHTGLDEHTATNR